MEKATVIIMLVIYSICPGLSDVIDSGITSKILTNSNWKDILEDEWLVKFYAPWCPACRHLESTWESLAQWSIDNNFKVAKVDVTQESGLSGRFIITSLPTVYHVKDGKFRQYTGTRTLEDFQNFITGEKWKDIEPISDWKSPSSHIMSFISELFEVSMKLKDLHTSLTDAYGIPVWVSFVIFGILIIIFGLLLGMGMVFISDYLFGPPCPPTYSTMEEITRDEKISEKDDTEQKTEENGYENGEDIPTESRNDKENEENTIRKRVNKAASTE